MGALAVAGLIVGEAMAFLRHRRLDVQWKPNLGTMMFQPYLRVVPMHLAILLGGLSGAGALVFLPLRMLADIGMYIVDERGDAARMQVATAEAPVEAAQAS